VVGEGKEGKQEPWHFLVLIIKQRIAYLLTAPRLIAYYLIGQITSNIFNTFFHHVPCLSHSFLLSDCKLHVVQSMKCLDLPFAVLQTVSWMEGTKEF
jgi:hypothetical protein